MRSPDMGHIYLPLNRNKRSLAIDLKAPDTLALFRQFIETADIFISNTRALGMKGLKLDYASVAAMNPSIIYCAAYGYSEKGPYAGRPAADDTIQAMSGLVDLQGRATAGELALVASVGHPSDGPAGRHYRADTVRKPVCRGDRALCHFGRTDPAMGGFQSDRHAALHYDATYRVSSGTPNRAATSR